MIDDRIHAIVQAAIRFRYALQGAEESDEQDATEALIYAVEAYLYLPESTQHNGQE